jgi:hypothetical protein
MYIHGSVWNEQENRLYAVGIPEMIDFNEKKI